MRKGSRRNAPARRRWKTPTVTAVAIRAETKSSSNKGVKKLSHPQPPAAPTTKLGFSFEMAFPLSARFD